jgi:hypothetical protein
MNNLTMEINMNWSWKGKWEKIKGNLTDKNGFFVKSVFNYRYSWNGKIFDVTNIRTYGDKYKITLDDETICCCPNLKIAKREVIDFIKTEEQLKNGE